MEHRGASLVAIATASIEAYREVEAELPSFFLLPLLSYFVILLLLYTIRPPIGSALPLCFLNNLPQPLPLPGRLAIRQGQHMDSRQIPAVFLTLQKFYMRRISRINYIIHIRDALEMRAYTYIDVRASIDIISCWYL